MGRCLMHHAGSLPLQAGSGMPAGGGERGLLPPAVMPMKVCHDTYFIHDTYVMMHRRYQELRVVTCSLSRAQPESCTG